MNAASLKVTPRANGTIAYDVRFRVDGQSKSLRFNTQASAEAWMTTYRRYGFAVARQSVLGNDGTSVPTVDEYATRYINAKSGVEGKTLDHYRGFMARWISPVMGGIPITAITPALIASWVNGMEGSAEKSVKNRHGFLFAMFAAAVNDGIIDRNPCKGTRIQATERPEMMALTGEQFRRLYECVPDHSKALVAFLLMTGMRFGEATALRRGDFNLTAETVRVSRSWKYSSARSWYIGPPKTKKSIRTISLPQDWRATIRPLVETSTTEYVFTNRANRPVRQSTFHKSVWDPARRKAWGLHPRTKGQHEPQLPRVHDLRHTHAVWLVASGLPLSYVQERMGHESINTTIAVYAPVATDYLMVTAEAMGRVLEGVLPITTK